MDIFVESSINLGGGVQAFRERDTYCLAHALAIDINIVEAISVAPAGSQCV